MRDRQRADVAALSSISPIRALPVELLAEIFKLTIHDPTHIKDAFRVSQVCADWRQIAQSTPQLWTGPIRVDLRTRSHDLDQVYVDGLKAWLTRSAPLPVPISFIPEYTNISPRVLEVVLTLAPRWRSLEVGKFWEHKISIPLSLVTQLAGGSLDCLEELDLAGRFVEDVDPSSIISFATVPRLRKLNMSIHPQIHVPWAQLNDLTLGYTSPDIALDTLAQCPNLTRASICTGGWTGIPEAGRDILSFSHLHTLTVSFVGERRIGPLTPFFDCLSTPALAELCLDFGNMMDNGESWTDRHFTGFQLRAPDITCLQLDYSILTSAQLRTALRHAPCLTHLGLTRSRYRVDDALAELTFAENEIDPLVPRLHHLDLQLEDGYRHNFTSLILESMIVSRWWTDAQLVARLVPPAVARWTHLKFLGRFSPQFLDSIRFLQRQGLSVDCASF
ncbi:hypothetical protein K438DRAFT_1812397 [Mycena galopus ATCC 62051]|nr:hypothetical protein K438DRAFT_1812397 [Mycena galopus ATCC 62051]